MSDVVVTRADREEALALCGIKVFVSTLLKDEILWLDNGGRPPPSFNGFRLNRIVQVVSKARTERAELAEDARRYRRLRILGAAPLGSKQLDNGTVLCAQNLDDFVDVDLRAHPSRGEYDG